MRRRLGSPINDKSRQLALAASLERLGDRAIKVRAWYAFYVIGSTRRFMWLYFLDMLGGMFNCFWHAFRTVNGALGLAVILLGVVGSSYAVAVKDLPPSYALLAVAVLFGWLFLKASYEKDQEREATCNAKLAAAGSGALESEKLRAVSNANAARLLQVQQQIYAYADVVPLGEQCTMERAAGWMAGACHLLQLTVIVGNSFYADTGCRTTTDAEIALLRAVGSLRGLAAALKADHLKG
jgi:hypothetical protein